RDTGVVEASIKVYYKINVYGAQLSSEACRELGFSSNLLCSSCNLLGQFNLNQLDPFCRQCCQEEAQLETRKVGFKPDEWEEICLNFFVIYS
uniref:Selenoprotein F n=1 Tax=Chrysolophus pictus TaxID=9089 RepID=A0A8C3LIV4_CHRPC